MNKIMRKKSRELLCLVLLPAIWTGCASVKQMMPQDLVSMFESREKRLARTYLEKAKQLETDGDEPEALEQFKIALAVDPTNQEAGQSLARMEDHLRLLAEEHFRKGLEFKRQGRHDLAEQRFLTALRLRPDNREAVEMIASLKQSQIKGYVVHRIQPGECLSELAAIYYGDPSRFPVIARYNNMADPAVVSVGQEIRIPELEGMEISIAKRNGKAEPSEEKEGSNQAKGSEPGAEHEVIDQVNTYRELGLDLFRQKRYEEALVEFNKVLGPRPNDKLAMEFSYQSSLEIAKALFEKQDYMAARNQFKETLKYKKDCQQCRAYIKSSEEEYKALHYKQGIQYYGMELLAEAIRQWELVSAIDPNYKRVEYYISKAKEMLKRLEELREEMREGRVVKEYRSM